MSKIHPNQSINYLPIEEKKKELKISTLSSGNVSKYKFLTGKDVLSEKDLLEKATKIKIFENSPLGNKLRKVMLQKNSIKNETRFVNPTKEKKTKQ